MKITNWKELKEFVDTLSEEQLSTPFLIEVAEQPWKKNVFVKVAHEDYIMNRHDSDEHGYRDEVIKQLEYDGTLKDVDMKEDYLVLNEKGKPMIACDN